MSFDVEVARCRWRTIAAAVFLCFGWHVFFAELVHAASQDDPSSKLQTVWEFPHQGIARFCYDQNLAIVFFRYDQSNRKSLVVTKGLDGQERVIAEFPGNPNERSISCSEDGKTIAALDGQRKTLFVAHNASKSLYRFSRYYAYSITGMRSLLAPYGGGISLPEIPELLSGPDLLKEMKVFIFENGDRTFFEMDNMYLDSDKEIIKYRHSDDGWKSGEKFDKPSNFYVRDIARCAKRDIATLSDDETARFMVLESRHIDGQDWLHNIGVRRILQNYRATIVITGSYGHCAFPLYSLRSRGLVAEGVIRVDSQGLTKFVFPEPRVGLANDEVLFSKDGCYVLVRMFAQVPDVAQFTLPQKVRLLRVSSRQCTR